MAGVKEMHLAGFGDYVGVEEEEKGEIQCNSQASVLGCCVLGGAITRMGNIGRRVVWEVGEERELGYFRHNEFNKVLWDIQMYLFIYLTVNCVLAWNSEGRSVLEVSPCRRLITDAKEIIQAVL